MNKLFILLILFTTSLWSNTDPVLGTVTGVILDKQLMEPIPYASVVVTNLEGEIVTGTVSAEDGTFELEKIPEGTYNFKIQFMGYDTYEKEVRISEDQRSLNMGQILLIPATAQLNDVTVVAERSTIEQRIDRKVVNVGKDLTTVGATAAEIMNRIPSVTVDQDGNLALRGSQNVRVLVDGKPTNMDVATLLKTIPSTSIKQIELITNPSAKYDPEGMSGIINIILYKNTSLGFNGNVAGGVTVGEKVRSNGSIDLNYREGKFNFYANLGAGARENILRGKIVDINSGNGEYPDLLFGNGNFLGKIGLDFYLNETNTLSFYTNQNFFMEYGRGEFAIRYPASPEENFSQIYDIDERNRSRNYNFAYRKEFEKDGHDLQFEADYNHYTNDEESYYSFNGAQADRPSYFEWVDKDEKTTLLNLDYVNPLSETSKLEVGAEARINQTENYFESDNSALEDMFYTYDRSIYSFYSTFGQELGKWAYQVGTRLENYLVDADQDGARVYEEDLFTLYPSAFVTYTPGEKNVFQVSYSRRVDRPGRNQVTPVRQVSTPLLTVMGNPDLQPQFTNSMEFNYTRKIKKASLSSSLFYRVIEDEIEQVVTVDPLNPEHIILTFHNSGRSQSYGVELSGRLSPADFWDFNADFNLYGQEFSGYLGTTYVEEEDVAYSIQTNNTFKATDRLRFQLFAMYRSPSRSLQFESEEMYFVNIGGRYSFLEDRASLSLNFNDIFRTQYQTFTTSIPVPKTGELRNDSRSVYLGFSYRFGGGESKRLQRKQREDNTSGGGVF